MIKELFKEVFKTLDLYSDGLEFLLLFRDEQDQLSFVAKNKDGRYAKIIPKKDYPEITGSCCFGKLKYLKTIFNSSFLDSPNSKISFNFDTASDKRTIVLKSISCFSDRGKMQYQAMDPLVNQFVLAAKKPISYNGYVVKGNITLELKDNYNEAIKVISSYEKPELVRLEMDNGKLMSYFDIRGDETVAYLSDSFDKYSDVSAKFDALHVRTLLSLHDGVLEFSDKALKVSSSLEYADYVFVLASKLEKR